jgi:hypothetical protein
MNRFFKTFAVVVLVLGMGIGAAWSETYAPRSPATDPGAGSKHIFFQSGVVDCNDVKYFKSGVTHGDVIQLVNLPNNTMVRSIGIRVTRASIVSGTSATVGDGVDPDGFITSTYAAYSVPYINLAAASTGVSVWNHLGPITAGAGFHFNNGVSYYYTGSNGTTAWGSASNHGAYFVSGSGISPYVDRDTIDMTIQVNKIDALSGVTPKFEWIIECQKLPIH